LRGAKTLVALDEDVPAPGIEKRPLPAASKGCPTPTFRELHCIGAKSGTDLGVIRIQLNMKFELTLVLLGFYLSAAAAAGPTGEKTMLGFGHDAALKQSSLETQFDRGLQRDNLREWMRRLTAHPHHLGSPYDKENAEFIAAQFRSWGYETQIEEFEVLFPTPRTRLLEMTAPVRFTASLTEPPLKEDSTSGLRAEQLPTYNAYSKDGDVTGELVYVNYGTPADYDVLAERGIDVKGKIVIARYGGCWRGIKPKVAAEHGAIGCLIYSDPRDDGYFQGDTYPEGAWRNQNGAQRGSVCDLPLYPGDPLTPGVGATKDAKRLPQSDAPSLAKIPVLPLSYADATPLLEALRGPVAPEAWRGALPLTYHLGPGPANVHLKLEFDWKQTPLYDVIARMPGAELPDQWIIRGNHHDAWVCGAEDPISGTVALMEEARLLAGLTQQGWKPRRTVVYAVWDGEEPGLLGSTEWVETHADELRQKAAVYVNTDSNDRGFLSVGGSHTLEKFVNEIAREITDPESKQTVAERWRAHRLINAAAPDRREIRERADLRIEALGSGSDYTPFLQHLGIASLNIGYGGEESGGSYHSIYDSFDHYTRFGDPNFEYGTVLVSTCGRVILRLADAEALPFEFSGFSDTIGKYVKEVTKLADELRDATVETNRLITERVLVAVADPKQPFVEPGPKSEVPYLNFAPLQNALAALRRSSDRFEKARAEASKSGVFPPVATDQSSLDKALLQLERSLTRPEGLPRRPWYQHFIYAPGFYTGYGVKTLPGVREAIEQRNWTEASLQIQIAADTIDNFAKHLNRCAELLPGTSH
jgi:N-acetylated-alpha-linked acidic dipeptidase